MENGSPEGLVIDNHQDGLFRVNRQAFTEPRVLEWEREKVFDQCWIYTGKEAIIPQAADTFIQALKQLIQEKTYSGHSLIQGLGRGEYTPENL